MSVPLTFAGNGTLISSTAFSIDFDETCLGFDPKDGDGDGTPDAVTFFLPPDFARSATYDAADITSEFFFVIFDPLPPLASFPDGPIAAIEFTASCTPAAGTVLDVPVIFAADPVTSFGDTTGQGVPGTTSDGWVTIIGPTPTVTSTPTKTWTPTETGTPSETPTKTFTPTETGTPSDTPTTRWTPVSGATFTRTVTPSNTASMTPSFTLTPINTMTWTPTATTTPFVPTATRTATLVSTATPADPSPTPSATPLLPMLTGGLVEGSWRIEYGSVLPPGSFVDLMSTTRDELLGTGVSDELGRGSVDLIRSLEAREVLFALNRDTGVVGPEVIVDGALLSAGWEAWSVRLPLALLILFLGGRGIQRYHASGGMSCERSFSKDSC